MNDLKTPWLNENFWNAIDTVLLDMDGTLLDLHFDNYFWQTALPKLYSQLHSADSEKTFDDLESMYHEHRGSLQWYCVDFWAEALQVDVMALKREHSHLIGFRPNVTDFLAFLRTRNITAVLVTNAHPKSLALKLEICALDHWIPHLFSSHDFNLPKEHQQFWPTFLKTFHFDKSKTVFIDDNDSVLQSAEHFGIKHCFSIEQPDSKKLREEKSLYPMISDFKELII